MKDPRNGEVERIDGLFARDGAPFAIRGARRVDARGVIPHAWLVSEGRSIPAVGESDPDF